MLLILAFTAAAIEKASFLATKSVSWSPIFISWRRLRRFAFPLTAAALLADLVVVVSVTVGDRVGVSVAAVLLVIYSAMGYRIYSRSSKGECQCFSFKILSVSSARGLLLRNGILIAMVPFIPLGTITTTTVIVGIVTLIVFSSLLRLTDFKGEPSVGTS